MSIEGHRIPNAGKMQSLIKSTPKVIVRAKAMKQSRTDLLTWTANGAKICLSDTGSVTRSASYTYVNGLLATATIQPQSPLQLLSTYDRNSFGVVWRKTDTWIDPACASPGWPDASCVTNKSRKQEMTYDANGRFALTTKNALNQSETRSYDSASGAQLSLLGPNLLTTAWEWDAFGRVTRELRADGGETRSYLKMCQGDRPAGAVTASIRETYSGANRIAVPSISYADSAGKTVRRKTWGFNGAAIVADQSYDDRGRPYESEQPHFEGATGYLAKRQRYDDLDRVTEVTTLDSAREISSTTVYQGLSKVLKNPLLQTRTETSNVNGQTLQVLDAKGGVTSFMYEPFGSLSQTVDPNGNVIDVLYNALGMKIQMRDPDLGQFQYDVDPIGQTWAQTSPKQRALGQRTAFVYDLLGRMMARYETDLESHWEYDTASMGIGALAEAYTGTSALKDYRRLHTYDGKARLDTTTQFMAGATYSNSVAYDAWGRVARQTYQRSGGAAKVFTLNYGNMGYLEHIDRGALKLWQVTAQDAAQRPIAVAFGNSLSQTRTYDPATGRLAAASLKVNSTDRLIEGYQYDALGSMSHRDQFWDGTGSGVQEDFTYDQLNRLFTARVAGQGLLTFTYDAAGNLRTKTGVGSGLYRYPVQGPGAVRPHAVRSITGIQGFFSYDDNGNQLAAPGRTAQWNSFDMPIRLSKGTVYSDFVYGPEHQRTRQDRSDGSSVVYAGSQEVETVSGQITVKTYWPNGIGVEIDRPGAVESELSWTHLDRLGSPIALSDASGALRVQKLAYDAWGKRRTPDGSATPNSLDGEIDNKGFTGHEMLDSIDLVHMNGRVYDPLIGKFLSGDPFVQDPLNGQNYNRYSYVLNNPTNLTDPTGFVGCTGSAQQEKACSPPEEAKKPESQADRDQRAAERRASFGWITILSNPAATSSSGTKASGTADGKQNGNSANKEREIVSDTQQRIGESNNGEIAVYERKTVREGMSQPRYATADQQMSGFIGLIINGPGERLLQDTGLSSRNAAIGAVAFGMINPLGRAAKGAKWTFGAFKSEAKWASQLEKRGWTKEQISEALEKGDNFAAENMVNKGNAATRFVNPSTGQSVVIDNVTNEVIHVGGPGFKY